MNAELRTQPRPACPVCGGPGTIGFERLKDRLFGVPGAWTMRFCADTTCGLAWLDPAPLAEDLALAYRSYYTHARAGASRGGIARAAWRAAKDGHWSRRFGYEVRGRTWKQVASLALLPFPTIRASLDALVYHLPPREGGRVLELGCGAGDALAALAGLGWDVLGLEPDPAAAEVARARGLPVETRDLLAGGFPDGAFDAVVSTHVIEHVPDPAALFAEAHRVLAPGGRFVAITPNLGSLGRRKFGRAWRGLEPPRHLQVFSRPALRRAVEAAGFRTLRLSTEARMATGIHAASRALAAGTSALEAERAPNAADRAFQAEERRALAHDPDAGEEILLVAARAS